MSEPSDDLARMRLDYSQRGLDEADADRDPLTLFTRWLNDAIAAQVTEPNAMVISTVGADGAPSSRTVLLKGLSAAGTGKPVGFEFYTNYTSSKASQLEANSNIAVTFPWLELERQVNVVGVATKLTAAESDAYFDVRPRASQLGAWASDQSSVIEDRAVLDARLAELETEFPEAVPRPPHWGGYRVVPHQLEFWQGRPSRLHDRLRYVRNADGWARSRLSP